ncbi:3-methyl-2-oxobutanoate hydroxymethyltransferase [Metapseudomonas otitidis]|uniref:3-methyl-2-oxobutanoate hydroxymethyltransferase n=1 Tax=Metapseudomonas otitidis TaxID=319939 RepID=A0A679GN51_9GAMM|nr:3-methyl-2-oxobutanoate hydroxymethyltransferase [Pseudomonas otitidis]MDG9784076.1 3-methyl-2-oxobutanoate hydroxymethyltransferase [Pseudomonas otitidis]MDH1109789.1 3-methyl-2-oxobutanoate hydroxymethyltransferase [Pseudomonas otitidis]MDH1161475.1 3-methyl-2-oxobutanoate hydroxymethyltransferase [Pseudomonas otitidis]MDH1167711.1 3-methyl-2-oxobutanoate hydroxymethyltransferase [Pseudomonas otitidis]WIF65524.1 3-methyl-2-oxobutanoate hydroxymethyltransferase [Pseudomonas otitidis]
MSSHTRVSRISVPELARRKGPGSIVSLTAYSTPMARWVDAQADLIIVGDSLGMVLYGLPSTLGVSLEMMIAHGQAVMRGSERACVAVDLPFGSYQASPEQAFHAAARVLRETGAAAVKLEAGEALAETVAFLVARGVPVLAHVGLMPQQVNVLGGFKAQGLEAAGAERVRRDALAMQAAGAFAVVLEGIAEPLARHLSEELAIPTIGIGASPACDGQVLVTEDALGLFGDYQPRFVKRYAALAPSIEQALAAYAEDVRQGRFPELGHCFGVKTAVG